MLKIASPSKAGRKLSVRDSPRITLTPARDSRRRRTRAVNARAAADALQAFSNRRVHVSSTTRPACVAEHGQDCTLDRASAGRPAAGGVLGVSCLRAVREGGGTYRVTKVDRQLRTGLARTRAVGPAQGTQC